MTRGSVSYLLWFRTPSCATDLSEVVPQARPNHPATATKETLIAKLKRMLQAVDKCPLKSHQKLELYKAGVCPRLSWLPLMEELPITWVERELEATTTGRPSKAC